MRPTKHGFHLGSKLFETQIYKSPKNWMETRNFCKFSEEKRLISMQGVIIYPQSYTSFMSNHNVFFTPFKLFVTLFRKTRLMQKQILFS